MKSFPFEAVCSELKLLPELLELLLLRSVWVLVLPISAQATTTSLPDAVTVTSVTVRSPLPLNLLPEEKVSPLSSEIEYLVS